RTGATRVGYTTSHALSHTPLAGSRRIALQASASLCAVPPQTPAPKRASATATDGCRRGHCQGRAVPLPRGGEGTRARGAGGWPGRVPPRLRRVPLDCRRGPAHPPRRRFLPRPTAPLLPRRQRHRGRPRHALPPRRGLILAAGLQRRRRAAPVPRVPWPGAAADHRGGGALRAGGAAGGGVRGQGGGAREDVARPAPAAEHVGEDGRRRRRRRSGQCGVAGAAASQVGERQAAATAVVVVGGGGGGGGAGGGRRRGVPAGGRGVHREAADLVPPRGVPGRPCRRRWGRRPGDRRRRGGGAVSE
uniref:Uncharacterized protein n=1 Tax=Zea mays TaxID=4577 RepID=A0A804NGI1_MAIZE